MVGLRPKPSRFPSITTKFNHNAKNAKPVVQILDRQLPNQPNVKSANSVQTQAISFR